MAGKTVLFVRHGQSLYNYAYSLRGAERREFMTKTDFRDAGVTPEGRQQAIAAGEALPAIWTALAKELPADAKVELVITSPLTRALETTVALVQASGALLRDVPILATPRHAEFVQHPCDEGTPLSELVATWGERGVRFEEGMPESWWAPLPETHDIFAQRVARFREWLVARPERIMLVVGHGTFLMKMSSLPHMQNCEVRVWRGERTEAGNFKLHALAPGAALYSSE